MREPTFGSYEELADMLVPVLPPYLDRPFAFFGHCGAALAGFEVALRLRERGLPLPARLFVSSQVAPHHCPYGKVLRMSDEELSQEVVALMREMGGSAPPADLLALITEVLRADVEAFRRYRKPAPVAVPWPTTVLGWRRDVDVPPELLHGWRAYGDADYHLLDGHHFSFLSAPADLTAVIERAMAAVERQPEPS